MASSSLPSPHAISGTAYENAQLLLRGACKVTPHHVRAAALVEPTRSDRPMSPTLFLSSTTPSLSEEEWDDGSSSSDNEGDFDEESEDYNLPENHNFHQKRSELLLFLRRRFTEWAASVQYDIPPEKGLRRTNGLPEALYLEEEEDRSETDFVMVSLPRRTKRHFHLACPYHLSDPEKYHGCLLQYDHRSIDGLIDHIKRHHAKPFYCPICSEVFDTVIHRDNHILKQTCEIRDLQQIDGVNHYQRAMLVKGDKWQLDETKRWQRIWATVFPSQPSPSPYLDQGYGLTASMARDFWDAYGWQCLSEFLGGQGLLEEYQVLDERSQDALSKVALGDLLKELTNEHELSAGCRKAGEAG
ncbi:hypothetical protein FZEAL_6185 [Fusarium zealandicum]|uniref:C2H2-type domain-containing protein n=1 Tax=Fusarium zealandicum TaxID=1053134 RepID=A0A8H4XJR9_9HYPO|nr:hypothetical protein FZEAL_6185 [Fusarium zealandicum]